MKVLVICPTYGRLPFLGRVLASFLDQDYVDKELLFINDDKAVQLVCNEENVHVMNLSKKITLGSKRNLGISFGQYDLYMHYDDDDVFLPGRISSHVNKHIENPHIYFYWNSSAYFLSDSVFSVDGCSSSAGSLKREGWVKCGGYADITKGEDVEFYSRVTNKLIEKDISNIDYVYNWSGLNYHATYSTEETIISEAEKINKQHNLKPYYEIIPNWKEYCNFVKLDRIYKETQTNVKVIHREFGVIDVVSSS